MPKILILELQYLAFSFSFIYGKIYAAGGSPNPYYDNTRKCNFLLHEIYAHFSC